MNQGLLVTGVLDSEEIIYMPTAEQHMDQEKDKPDSYSIVGQIAETIFHMVIQAPKLAHKCFKTSFLRKAR